MRFRHFGTLYQGRSLDPLAEAFAKGSRDLTTDTTVELYGVSEWQPPAHLPTDVSITTHGTLTHSAAVAKMMEPAVLVLVQPAHFGRQIPTKLFEYLCTGNPVLVIANRDSAVWALASGYSRCRLLEYGAEAAHAAVVDELIADWNAGRLRQEETASDTSSFTKTAVGNDFVALVRQLLAPEA